MIFSLFLSVEAFALDEKALLTKYTAIHYSQDSTLSDFAWRISGKKINMPTDFSLAKNAVDRIIERVESLLDMFPDKFHIDIYLQPQYQDELIAFYNKKTRSITLYADRITDGILAHEMAHAVINAYFKIPPPEKVQEILCQYVDKQLWTDY